MDRVGCDGPYCEGPVEASESDYPGVEDDGIEPWNVGFEKAMSESADGQEICEVDNFGEEVNR